MDDMLLSFSSQEEAYELKTELTALLAKGGFKLTKWATNFEGNGVHDKALTLLGLECNNKADTPKVSQGIEFEPESRWNQRKALSVVSSVFDPLGFLASFCHSWTNHTQRNMANGRTTMGFLHRGWLE